MKEIRSLIPDIQALVQTRGWFHDELAGEFSQLVAGSLRDQYGEKERYNTLRLSAMGPRCPRALWYSIHHPECAEPMPPWAEVKFSFGHIIEALAITLAKAAGHEVTGEQDELRLDGIVGHRDCVVDGCLVDVKSVSSMGFTNYKTGLISKNDSFGYLDQLDGYVVASRDDPLVRVKDRGYILAIDKQLGHMCLYEHIIRPDNIKQRIAHYKAIVGQASPPPCECGVKPYGSAGNTVLDTRASYSNYKYCCFPQLRVFNYKPYPLYFTKVVRTPDVQEIFRPRNKDSIGLH